MDEHWKEVESKGVRWLVTSHGRVRVPAHSYTYLRTRNGKRQEFSASWPERNIAPYKTKGGYLEVAAQANGRRVKHLVHRLIGMAFVPGYAPDLTINHIDGDKLNNALVNLEWVSLARNTQHQWETGLVDLRGDNNPSKKLTSKQVVYIRRLLAQGIPAHALSVVAGVSISLVALIRDGKRWPTVTHGRPVLKSFPALVQISVGNVDA